MGEPDVLGYRLEQARLAVERAGWGIARVVCTGCASSPSAPLRVVRQRRIEECLLELTVAPEVVVGFHK